MKKRLLAVFAQLAHRNGIERFMEVLGHRLGRQRLAHAGGPVQQHY